MSISNITSMMKSFLKPDMRKPVQKCASIRDMQKFARKKIPLMVYDFVDGGAAHECTLRSNESDFDSIKLIPKNLIDVSRQDISITLGGETLKYPFYFGPAGLVRVVGNKGEISAVRVAGRYNIPYTISTSSSYSIEELKKEAKGPLWFQLYLWRNKDIVNNLIERASHAGCDTLVLTVDVPLNANRLRDLRNGMSIPPKITLKTACESFMRPKWVADILSGNPIGFRNFIGVAEGDSALSHSEFINKELSNLAASWEDLRLLRKQWNKKLYIKGILSVEDAMKALEYGVDGIIVSNHGGRQLDSVPSSISVLPKIVEAVSGRCEIILDGGVRSGIDIVKAICLGATAVSIARPWVFGVAAAGEDGVNQVVNILEQEVKQTLALIGAPAITSLNRGFVTFPNDWK